MKKVILDVDTGIDDALAIAYAVKSKDIDLVGLTTSFGNTSLEEATRNTLQLLELMGREDIPVYPGAEKPLFRPHLKQKAAFIHGDDAMGNHSLPLPKTKPSEKHAVEFIIEMVHKHPNEITLVFVASMTNLALAIMKDPSIVEKVERVVIMGGAATVAGNATPAAEANIYTDPEAAEYVFRSGLTVTMVGLDVTMQTLLPREQIAVWREKQTPYGDFMAHIVEFYINAYQNFLPGIKGCALHDPLAIGAVINPDFIKTKPMHIQVDCEGIHSVGRTVADLRGIPANPPNVDVALEVDAEGFLEHFLSVVV
ncbi:nucleoside hydrolase [Neobacillus piezotolerans]|uniref:Nucleoside hydrolase n=1 Tax=Neobacillus piezotolerans TaxID=2259171 RepID=A0A3D8GTH8_9BACI|nr:nucleoside hydrolase [Neobacillus piezotolerans]RDU37755.1 nucleoside hydrolase [Neobacillus piezotolerans]